MKCINKFKWMYLFLFIQSCSSMDYSVEVENVGKKEIWVNDFNINEIKHHRSGIIGVGILPPNISSTTMSITEKPHEKVKISWQAVETGLRGEIFQTGSVMVDLEVPKEFWKPLIHHLIIIYLNPDNETAEVIYSGYNLKEDKDYYINSKGESCLPNSLLKNRT